MQTQAPQNLHDPQRRLSPHFTLAELTVSNSGARAGLRNVPVGTALEIAARLAQMRQVTPPRCNGF